MNVPVTFKTQNGVQANKNMKVQITIKNIAFKTPLSIDTTVILKLAWMKGSTQ